ncbi:unnamed protein product [Rotaria magnacalcarata]|uniref:Uncharacterized protein n=1 Tax=Rotaria magnacalcarata TaxID=392030 RepID=A0A820AG32_9BILA|nr:unnamed protein product [Rotaria magnacalcarata]
MYENDKHTNLVVLEVLDPDDDIDDEDDSIACKQNIVSSPPHCHITLKISVNNALRGHVLHDVNTGSSSTTNTYPIKHYYKKAREFLASWFQDSTTNTMSDRTISHHHHHHHHQKSFPTISRQLDDQHQHQQSISSPTQKLCQDEDSCPVPYSSYCSPPFSDGEILDNELYAVGSTVTTTTITGQFLWIDYHHPRRRHSFVNELIDGNYFHYHPSSPFVDHPPSIEDLRKRLASAYILTAGPSVTNELSLQHATSINECSIHLIEDVSSTASRAMFCENLLNDEIGLHYMYSRSFKKEFSQENIPILD